MKKLLLFAALLVTGISFSQVGIGTTIPDASAQLDVTSTSKGFMPPRMTYAQKTAIATPGTGLIVWCTDCGVNGEMQVYNGTAWINFSGAPGEGLTCSAIVDNSGVRKRFMCYNLGADTSLDPHVPVQGLHGNYYQWGRRTVVADASTPSGTIAGWNTTEAANGAWSDGSKTNNDPCPSGFRIPTSGQWEYLLANNSISRTGSWLENTNNFGTAIHFGTSITKTLTLPAAGFRMFDEGELFNRGINGSYWSSTETESSAFQILFSSNAAELWTYRSRALGNTVRCISE